MEDKAANEWIDRISGERAMLPEYLSLENQRELLEEIVQKNGIEWVLQKIRERN